jgi:PAS domain S-box-containing protein
MFRFLLLEDKLLDTELIQVALMDSGIEYNLLRVDTRADFVTALETETLDLILAAYAMPGFGGLAALEVACDLRPETPFIFISASLGEELAIEALKCGATDYVLKQRLERLAPCVQQALREAQERRDRSSLALRKSEAKYRTLFESIDEGFCICELLFDQNGTSIDYRFLEVNSMFEAMTGLEQALGKTARELVPNLEADWVKTYERVVQTRESVRFEQQSIAMNRWFDVNAFCIGEPRSNQFAILFTNITDRKKAEQERDRFLAVGSDLQVITNSHGYFQWVSPTFERVLGWSLDEMISRPWTDCVHPDDLNPSISEVNHFFSGNETFAFENRYRHKDGSYRWFLWNAQPYSEEEVIYGAAVDITDRKQSEEALRESEELKESILESSRDCIKVLTLDSRIFYISAGGLCLLEIDDPASILNTVWVDKWQGEDYENAKAAIAAATMGGTGQFQGYLPTAKGTPKWWDSIVTPVQDAAGRVVQLVAISRDITDRKQAETALQKSEEQSQNILDSITDAFFALDENWLFTYVNRAAEAMLDRSPSDLIGKNLWEEYPGLNGSEFEPLYRRAASERVDGSLTAFYPDHDRWYEVHTYPAANGVTAYFRNVTDQIQSETALRQTSAELERQLQRFDAIAASVPDFIYTFDRSGRFTYSNQQLLNLLQKTSAEVIDKNFFDIEYPTDLATQLQNQIQQVIETRQPVRDETPYTSAFGTHDYEYIFVPLLNANGTVEAVAGVTRDITDRKRLLQQEKSAREEAERANRIKDEFLAVLSHELRSPLNPILGWTRLLQSRTFNPSRQAEALKTIERNAKLQSQLIEDLLDISRIMQGKLSLTAAPVSLTSVISAALETVRLAVEAKGIALKIDLDPATALISGDAARLQQVVWNLLTNAVKFTPNGGQVIVELRQLDRLAQIRVIDTGKGITPNFLAQVFEYFRQEDGSTTRKFGGLGLGLAIVRQIVEMHGGTVWAESQGENQGATFIVQLPILQQTTSISSEPIAIPASEEVLLESIQILLIDDEQDARELQVFLLEQSGANVTAVTSGLEALQALDQFIPNVIVSDVGMADMDGYMLIQQIRSRSPNQGGTIPAIALTAYAAEVDQQKALQVGFQVHLTKPVEAEKLVKAIASLCLRH